MKSTSTIKLKDVLKVALKPTWENFGIWLSSIILLTGVFFLGWDTKVIVLAYALETIVIGVIHVFKMIAAAFSAKDPGWEELNKYSAVFLVVFFCFHYFIFVTIQTGFILSFFNYNFSFFGNSLWESLSTLFAATEMKGAFLTIILNNVYDAVRNYFLPRKYKNVDMSWLMFQPYVRVFVQQFVVIFGGGTLLITKAVSALASILIVIRAWVDLVGVAITTNSDLRKRLLDRITKDEDNPEKKKKLREMLEDMMEG